MAATCSVFLNVQDIGKSLAFYKRLGFKATGLHKARDGRVWWADLALDGAEIGLGAIEANDDPAYRQWVSTPLGAGVVVYFTVPNVEKYWKLAQKAGVTIEAPLEDRAYGRVFTVNDPDEYTITFLTEPGMPRGRAASARRKAKKGASEKSTAVKRIAARRSAKAAKRAGTRRA